MHFDNPSYQSIRFTGKQSAEQPNSKDPNGATRCSKRRNQSIQTKTNVDRMMITREQWGKLPHDWYLGITLMLI